MTYMNLERKGAWLVRWSNMGLNGDENYVATFSCNGMGVNILLPLNDLKEMIVEKRASNIPFGVLVRALALFSKGSTTGQEKAVA